MDWAVSVRTIIEHNICMVETFVYGAGMFFLKKRSLHIRDEGPVLAKNRIRGSILQTKGDFKSQ